MSISAKLILLAQAIAADVKALSAADGDLSTLSTTAKGSLVAAINELYILVGQASGAEIDDTAGADDTDKAWSASKITAALEAAVLQAKSETKNELIDGAGEAYDTFKELRDLLVDQDDALAVLTTLIGKAVRFDEAQTLTDQQKDTARTNIGAASVQSVENVTQQISTVSDNLALLVDSVGDADADLVAAYNAAKA